MRAITRGELGSARTMLILDDEPDLAEYVALAAQSLGFQTIVAKDADDFMGRVNDEVTHIVLDLFMPGMDGVQVIRALSQRRCRAQLVLVSGFDQQMLGMAEELALKQGLDVLGHLAKPIRLVDLENLLGRERKVATARSAAVAREQVLTREELAKALAADQFFLAYQPQVDIATQRLVGMEALVRWRRPNHGITFPDQFIGQFEALGMADDLTWMVLQKGLMALRDNGSLGGLHLAINVSAESLQDLAMPERFLSTLDEYAVNPGQIVLEITESRLIRDLASSMDILMRLRLKGFQISIDDFGTGYAMMDQLRHVPANEIKIDHSFTRDVLTSKRARVVVEKTIEIGHELGLRVVAEGVEEWAQLDFLSDKGCHVAQGYLFGKPGTIDDLARFQHR